MFSKIFQLFSLNLLARIEQQNWCLVFVDSRILQLQIGWMGQHAASSFSSWGWHQTFLVLWSAWMCGSVAAHSWAENVHPKSDLEIFTYFLSLSSWQSTQGTIIFLDGGFMYRLSPQEANTCGRSTSGISVRRERNSQWIGEETRAFGFCQISL